MTIDEKGRSWNRKRGVMNRFVNDEGSTENWMNDQRMIEFNRHCL